MSRTLKKNITLNAESTVQKLSIAEGSKEYRELRAEVLKAGILDRDYTYYALLSLGIFAGFAFSLYELIIEKNGFIIMFWSILIAFFTVQIAGILHDAGHRAIFKSPKLNDFVGHVSGAFTAMAYNGWKTKHNMHHAHTNQEDEDPDLEIPLFSFTQKRLGEKSGLARLMRRYQAFLYYPMGVFVVFSVRFGSIKYFVYNFKWSRIWELAFFATGFFVWFISPFLLFDLGKALLFILTSNIVAGFYLLNVFAPNHKGMPQLKKGQKFSFLEQQIITARNIYGDPITDFVYLGLNYQMEHHLFPDCPRNKLKKVAPYIRALCKKLGLEYTETTVLESNKIILAELNKTAILATQ